MNSPVIANLLRKLATFTRSDGLPVVRVGGRVWSLTPAGMNLFGPTGPDLDAWVANGATVVKSNSARTVYRVELPGAVVMVKHCKINGMRAWARELIRLPKARLEFENALALGERGVTAIEPLAWGGPDSHRPGESFLITRALTNTVPFRHYLEHDLPALPANECRAARRQVARTLGEYLAKLHDAGVVHPDPHPGNLLVEMSPQRVLHFVLIDLHAVHIRAPLGWRDSRENLVLFNRWFQLRASRADRARFWIAYRRARTTLAPPTADELRAGARELEHATHASNLRFWAGRESRCVGSNRYFRRISRGMVRGFAVRDLPDEFLQSLLASPDAALASGGILKDSRTSSVAVLMMPTPEGPVPVVLKRVNLRARIEPLKNLLRPSQVLRSWVNGHTLLDRRMPTPRPLAVFHRYRRGLPAEGYLLTEYVPAPAPLDAATPAAFTALARLLRALHDRGVSHRDLKAANILLAHGTEPTLIDLVGVRTGVRLSEARRAKELARLNASFLGSPTVTLSDRLRFLRAYLAAGSGVQADWKNWWGMVSRATAAKAARNRRAGRALG